MSCTVDRSVALNYAVDGKANPMVFEIQQGMIDRGADLSWLSQVTRLHYHRPLHHRRHHLTSTSSRCSTRTRRRSSSRRSPGWRCSRDARRTQGASRTRTAPQLSPRSSLIPLQVQETRVDGNVLVVNVTLSLNMSNLMIEEVLEKMARSHVQLLTMLADEFRHAGAPERALVPLESLKIEALRKPPSFFNVADNFHEATGHALEAQKQVPPASAIHRRRPHTLPSSPPPSHARTQTSPDRPPSSTPQVFQLLGEEKTWSAKDGKSNPSSKASSRDNSPKTSPKASRRNLLDGHHPAVIDEDDELAEASEPLPRRSLNKPPDGDALRKLFAKSKTSQSTPAAVSADGKPLSPGGGRKKTVDAALAVEPIPRFGSMKNLVSKRATAADVANDMRRTATVCR